MRIGCFVAVFVSLFISITAAFSQKVFNFDDTNLLSQLAVSDEPHLRPMKEWYGFNLGHGQAKSPLFPRSFSPNYGGAVCGMNELCRPPDIDFPINREGFNPRFGPLIWPGIKEDAKPIEDTVGPKNDSNCGINEFCIKQGHDLNKDKDKEPKAESEPKPKSQHQCYDRCKSYEVTGCTESGKWPASCNAKQLECISSCLD